MTVLKPGTVRAENPEEPGGHPPSLMDETLVNPVRRGTWLSVAMLALFCATAHAGVIRGTVRVPSGGAPRAALDPYAGNANALPGAAAPAQGRAADAVIWVEKLPAETAAALPERPGRARLVQEGQTFKPRVLAVAVGNEVDFPNRDPIYHNVFSLSPVRRFDLGKYPRGQSRTVAFRRTGVAHVFCDIHSNMEAFVVVVPNRAFAQPDAAGAFALPELPAGDYVLVLWHPDSGEARTRVTVPADGDVRVALGF
jgi:plastocyanin